MKIIETPRFKKVYKKLHDNQRASANAAIDAVIADPNIGVRKVGRLSRIYVYKFKMLGQLMLLGYEWSTEGEIILTFVDMGTHENFYRDLKK